MGIPEVIFMARRKLTEEEKALKSEIKRLNDIFENVESKRKNTCEKLVKEAAYIAIKLDKLRITIDNEGLTDYMAQGDYEILREHPAVKVYNNLVQRYTAIIKVLLGELPKEVAKEVSDGFEAFAHGRDG